jgi:hypothetical protein
MKINTFRIVFDYRRSVSNEIRKTKFYCGFFAKEISGREEGSKKERP